MKRCSESPRLSDVSLRTDVHQRLVVDEASSDDPDMVDKTG